MHEARDVATGAREAADEAAPNRITNERKHNRDALCCSAQRHDLRVAYCEDGIWLQTYQFVCVCLPLLNRVVGTDVDAEIASSAPAALAESFLQRSEPHL